MKKLFLALSVGLSMFSQPSLLANNPFQDRLREARAEWELDRYEINKQIALVVVQAKHFVYQELLRSLPGVRMEMGNLDGQEANSEIQLLSQVLAIRGARFASRLVGKDLEDIFGANWAKIVEGLGLAVVSLAIENYLRSFIEQYR